MAGTTKKLVLTFTDREGKNMSLSYSHVSAELEATDVKALMTGIITNGSIFASTPVTAKGAKVVTTSEDDIDISE
ncbi:MAG: DUF2922 domain-containing protein [Synergistaceae bacterium]|nr:DUF2922 domain-containing protein [Synergistaceae bacterium]